MALDRPPYSTGRLRTLEASRAAHSTVRYMRTMRSWLLEVESNQLRRRTRERLAPLKGTPRESNGEVLTRLMNLTQLGDENSTYPGDS